ncbi:MAG: sugar phosphate isomerase/epimerase [Niameybacter sp.]
MKIGVFTVALGNKTLDEACAFFKENGANAVEIGCGGFPGKSHCDPKVLLADPQKLEEFKATIARHDLVISALSCHANPVHPNKDMAKAFDEDLTDAILLAEKLGINIVNTFSGCPGDSDTSAHPNWVTCPWPEDFLTVLDYQWNAVLIPYWKEKVKFATAHGVDKIGLEMHPGFCVYNPETLLKLRNAVGPEIGANFDPSHLVWQGIDPVEAIKILGKEKAIFHFHAKDTKIDKTNTAQNGVLDTKHYGNVMDRAWSFRSVGYGNDLSFWKDISSALRLVGYDHVMSIEHEDILMSQTDGLKRALECLKQVVLVEPQGEMWWA